MKTPKGWGATFPVAKSKLQKKLESQGCIFKGQEYLGNHEPDPDKPCYCGRPYAPWRMANGSTVTFV